MQDMQVVVRMEILIKDMLEIRFVQMESGIMLMRHGIETLFSTDEFREVAENTTIKEGLIEKIKSAQKEQQENNLQNGER